jgi:hypothetical protein
MSTHYRIGKHHMGCRNNSIVVVGSTKLSLKFLPTKTPLNPLPKFTTNPINIPLMTTFVLGATTVSTHVVVMTTFGDWITSILVGCLWISTTIASDILGETKLIQVCRCPIMWLRIGIFCGAECGREYTFGTLFLDLPIPYLSIYSRLQRFLVLGPMIDPLMSYHIL